MLDGPADADLVARISHDDAEAFRECYQRHSEAVYNVALRILGGPAQAADLTQEVFLTLHQRSREIQQADRLGGWLLRIAVNLSIDWWRKGKGDPVSLDGVAHLVQDPAGRNPVDRLMDWEEEQRLSRAILELSEPLRQVVVMRYVEELSYQEIAELLQLPIGTVKSRIFRAHEALIEYLGSTVRGD